MSTTKSVAEPRRKRGRPRKSDYAETGGLTRREQSAIMTEYRRSMLASPKSAKVLHKILDAALDDDHKAQAVAWKIVADRLLPVAAFTEESSAKPTIQVNISTVNDSVSVNGSTFNEDGDVVDGA